MTTGPTMLHARQLVREHFGYSAFRSAQQRVIRSLLDRRDVLAILPTGGGKSLCFQIPALLFEGVTLVVSPLISLMQDQVSALLARGIPAASLNSTVRQPDQRRILENAKRGRIRLLYTSPERLKRLVVECRALELSVALLAVDEAHCIAEWGHDFRPAYRALRHRIARLGAPPVAALTGSATPAVEQDIVENLGLGRRRRLEVHRGSFDRPNLWFGVKTIRSESERLRALLDLLQGDDRMALVYTPTRSLSEALARAVTQAGQLALPYHAGLSTARRGETLERFLNHEVQVITATSAFGMGIDKSDVRLVVHWALPPSPEAYYQEAGRAGRDGEFARCVLLYRPGDARIHRLQLGVTFPAERLVESIWRGRVPAGTPRNVVESAERLRRELHPERGAVDWRSVRRRRRHAEERIVTMERYGKRPQCRRRTLLAYFGERLDACCGCDRCRQPRAAIRDSPEIARRLRRLGRAIRGCRVPWGGGGGLLAPATMRRLALDPPPTLDALAGEPGVGPTLVARIGPRILEALEVDGGEPQTADPRASPLRSALLRWRSEAAGRMGVQPFEVLPESACSLIDRNRPASLAELSRIHGLGPGCRLKFGEEILRIVRSYPATPPSGDRSGAPGAGSVS